MTLEKVPCRLIDISQLFQTCRLPLVLSPLLTPVCSLPPPSPVKLRPINPPPVRFDGGLVEGGLALVAWSCSIGVGFMRFNRV